MREKYTQTIVRPRRGPFPVAGENMLHGQLIPIIPKTVRSLLGAFCVFDNLATRQRVNIHYHPEMVSKTFNIFASKAPPKATRDALDVAARYFVYKLYDATRREPMQWVALKGIDEAPATIARAVERGWVVLQELSRKPLDRKAALTDEGRRLARKRR
jgi:hypothetical protein